MPPQVKFPDDHTPGLGPSRSSSLTRSLTLILAVVLIACGFAVFQAVQIGDLFLASAGIVGGALALTAGLLFYNKSIAQPRTRALARALRELGEQEILSQRSVESARASHRELSRLVESVSDCLWSTRVGADGSVEREYLSPVIEKLTGYPVEFFFKEFEKPEDEPWIRIIVPEERDEVLQTYLRDERPGVFGNAVIEFRITRADGGVVWLRDNRQATQGPSGEVFYDGVVTDITERKEAEEDRRNLEERIQQTQKLEGIGLLAGGVAHDFNNLLVGILGNADLAAGVAGCPIEIRESLVEIEKSAQRASELCRELLVYSGRAPYVTAPIDLASLVREMERLLQLTLAPGVSIVCDFAEGLAAVEGDVTQFQQLIMNLITNSADSMAGRPGKIQISLEERECDQVDFARIFTHDSLSSGRYVVLSVSDTGCGMTDATLSRIFDPFFTTKSTGRGLGLAAALGIVRGHDGAISVTSEVGVGTRSLVYLPACDPQQEQASEKSEVEWNAQGIVLLVDDDDSVRRVGTRMLENLGMKVIAVASGEEALVVINGEGHELRCVVLDLMMPGMGGTETLRAIRRKDRKPARAHRDRLRTIGRQ